MNKVAICAAEETISHVCNINLFQIAGLEHDTLSILIILKL